MLEHVGEVACMKEVTVGEHSLTSGIIVSDSPCSIRLPMRMTAAAGVLVCAFVPSPYAHAQGYPAKPIRLIVPTSPGGGIDFSARALAPRLSEILGQSIVIENRPGGSTIIGTELAARAAPNGYTLLMS